MSASMHASLVALILAGSSHSVDPFINQSPFLSGTAWKPKVELVLVDADSLTRERQAELETELTNTFAAKLKEAGLDSAPKPVIVEKKSESVKVTRDYTPTVVQQIVVSFSGDQVVYSCHTTAHARLPQSEAMGVVWMDATETQRSPKLNAELRGPKFGWLLSICAQSSSVALAKAIRLNQSAR